MGNSRLLTIALIGLVILLANHLTYEKLEGARLDLTSDNLYSLTDGTLAIIERMNAEGVQPIDIELYFSETTGKTLPRFIKNFVTYDRFLRSLLKEYERAAKGRVRLRFVDPITEAGLDAFLVEAARVIRRMRRGTARPPVWWLKSSWPPTKR